MKNRFAIKIAGASGQGINTLGEILSKSFVRAGHNVFAYREYPSLIKGGHATYQIDFSSTGINSPSQLVNLLFVLNEQKTDWHLSEIEDGGLIIHDILDPRINEEEAMMAKKKRIKYCYVPALELSNQVGGNELTSNIVSLGTIWRLLGQKIEILLDVIAETFADKPKYVELDKKCAQVGFDFDFDADIGLRKRFRQKNEIETDAKQELHTKQPEMLRYAHKSASQNTGNLITSNAGKYLISGNHSLCLGMIAADVKLHYAYPMTPSSSILSYLAEIAKETKMIVKQAEDEITAAAMAIGSMHMGIRAMTATSGGGFDLMTEHLSLAAMIEVPFVCVIAQRPGPATGMPTWTAQADLLLACFSGHGEYTRCVISITDAADAYSKIQIAFNLAEKFQIPVLVLTDKFIAESLYTTDDLTLNQVKIVRNLIDQSAELAQLKSADRYEITESGVSNRWLIGLETADYNANSDEHDESGNVTEEANISEMMITKRIRKQHLLLKSLPDPVINYNEIDVNDCIARIIIVGWGSTKSAVLDCFEHFAEQRVKIEYLSIDFLWPFPAEFVKEHLSENEEIVIFETNATGQLAQLIKMQVGIDIKNQVLKSDGRPFYPQEIITEINKIINN